MKSYDINVEDQNVFFHILNQMQATAGNVSSYKGDIMESFSSIDKLCVGRIKGKDIC